MTRAVNVLALVKDDQRYVFLFDENSYDELLRQLGEAADDEDLSFTWYDAAVMSQRVREIREERKLEALEALEVEASVGSNRLDELD